MPRTRTIARNFKTDATITFGLISVIFFFIASGLITYWNVKLLKQVVKELTRTHEVIINLDELMSFVKDAETGQRGFLLTGNEFYLQPYNVAVTQMDWEIAKLQFATKDNEEQQQFIPLIKKHIANKMVELDETIQLRKNKGFDAARAVVMSDRGKSEMDLLRSAVGSVRELEQQQRTQRIAEMDNAYRTAIISGVLTGGVGVLLSAVVARLVRRAATVRMRQEWLQSGQVGLSLAMGGEQRLDQLGDSILKYFSDYLSAKAGVAYGYTNGHYRRMAMIGVPTTAKIPLTFEVGDGLLGQVVKTNQMIKLDDIPDGYLTMSSALGEGKPKHLVIVPVRSDGVVNAVLELGLMRPLDDLAIELLEKVSDTISVAIRSASYRANLQNLLEETQRQAEELRAQSEELRVSNEELEEQSRALKVSQTNLEQQQAELEQINTQLEEQTQLLENQRDDLTRSQVIVQQKAHELEQASRYKSDFLANMSHELRTPLNSSLILAKLLADNPGQNLSDEQVKYAKTIQSSGNDLLVLINDILDLSKIEAGHMEIRPETMALSRLVNDLSRMFEPMAKAKKLTFLTNIEAGCPASVETDRHRLEQVLKNLISNALKFTETGTVTLNIQLAAGNQVAFSVVDTGIGIEPGQQRAIFEAFRQADSTISRKYGGTGLGLSISRELTRLLGGAIELESTPGEGSVFTIVLPQQFDLARVIAAPLAVPVAPMPFESSPKPIPQAGIERIRQVEDDRDKVNAKSRSILVVEDDESFARILYDLVHELDFLCLIASTAEEAMEVVKQYLPSAVILDVGLPDHSGLAVLDQMKRNTRTRHIPVHVVSAGDHAQTAFSLGAIGYMIKPVKREEIMDALKQLESKFEQHMRRVLIVEDDPVQRDSVAKLISTLDAETVEAGSASECLERLKETTFDCMVLDLTLPDATGYSLLETLSREDAYSFPPVIVYTGRDLSSDEELKLRRYSKSIIIKGAKSPERLLDEVTLFLHQVVSELPHEQQKMLEKAHNRDAVLEGRKILVVEDDVRNVYALTSILEPRGAVVLIARNGREAITMLDKTDPEMTTIDLVLMDVMMPEMDGMTATRIIRKNARWKNLPIIMLTAKAMKDDQERCLESGANDYMAKPLDVEKLLSLVRVWMPR